MNPYKIVVQLTSTGFEKAKKDTKQLEQSTKNVTENTKKLNNEQKKVDNSSNFSKMSSSLSSMNTMLKATIGYLGAMKVFDIGKQFISTPATFEQIEVKLRSIAGTTAEAKEQMKMLQKFAAETPYSLQEISNAFVKMQAYGLPVDQMRAYGDLASAMGKSFDDVVEAMADASTGEFERMKELGFKVAQANGQAFIQWSDSFGKMRTTIVENNKEAILSTLAMISDSRFAGAMDDQSKTWNGVMSNMQDAWEVFVDNVGRQTGLFDGLKSSISAVSQHFQDILKDKDMLVAIGEVLKSSITAVISTLAGFSKVALYFESIVEVAKGMKDAFVGIFKHITVLFEKWAVEFKRKWYYFVYELGKNLEFDIGIYKTDNPFEGYLEKARELNKEVKDIEESLKTAGSADLKTALSHLKASDDLSKTSDMMTSLAEKMKNTISEIDIKSNVYSQKGVSQKQDELERKKRDERLEGQNKIANTFFGSANQLPKTSSKKTKTRDDNDILQDKLDYFNALKQYQEAAKIELEIYRNEIAEKSYTLQEQKQLLAAKERELQESVSESQKNDMEKRYNETKEQQDKQLEYLTKTQQFEEAKNLKALMYKNELIQQGYTLQQQQEMEVANLKELELEYQNLREEQLNSRKDFLAGFQQYMQQTSKYMEDYASKSREVMENVEWSLQSAFSDFFDYTSESFLKLKDLAKNILLGILQSISQVMTQMIAMQTMKAAMSFFGGGYANGGVFINGAEQPVRAFATGGVVTTPTMFSTSRGPAIMGEAGPEAIMPLTRKNGKLGVEASNIPVPNSSASVNVNVIVNNNSKAVVNQSSDSNGNITIDILDKQLADRFMNHNSETQKVMSNMYNMQRK